MRRILLILAGVAAVLLIIGWSSFDRA